MSAHIPGYKPEAVELFRCQTTAEFAAFLHFAAGVGFNGKADIIGLDVVGRGALYFENGRIVHATESTVTGIDAVAHMLVWEKTEIHLLRRVVPPRHEFSCNTDNLIMDATLLADQNAALWRAQARIVSDVPEPVAHGPLTTGEEDNILKRPIPAFWLLVPTLLFLLVSSCHLLTSKKSDKDPPLDPDVFESQLNKAMPRPAQGLDMVNRPIPAGDFRRVFENSAGVKKEALVSLAAFWIADTEVTQADFTKVMGRNPSAFRGADLPVETVTWDEAKRYCEILTGMERALNRLPLDWEYRLPTEFEWEYACLANQKAPPVDLDDYCWHQENAEKTTHPARSKQPNAWKLYNMPGNVNEWCLDWIGRTPFANGDNDNAGAPPLKACRGGSWAQPLENCSPRWSIPIQTTNATNIIGFRPVLAPVGQRPSVTWESP